MSDVLACVIVLTSFVSTVFHGWLDYKRWKKPKKDEVWETAARLMCSAQGLPAAEHFAELYEELKAFKDNGCTLGDCTSLAQLAELRNGNNNVQS